MDQSVNTTASSIRAMLLTELDQQTIAAKDLANAILTICRALEDDNAEPGLNRIAVILGNTLDRIAALQKEAIDV